MLALETAYRSHRRRLLRVARRFGDQHHAEDIVQDAFAWALDRERRGTLDTTQPLYGYLRCVVQGRGKTLRCPTAFVGKELGHSPPSVVTRISARQVWQALTPAERLAVANLHILEATVSRTDQGLFARRIRLAGQRLRDLQ